MEDSASKETLIHPQNAWLFDVDGVITNPLEKAVTEPEMIPEITKRLKSGEPVALVSGRALPWLITQVVDKIESEVADRSVLGGFFVSAEFGGVSVFYEDGERIESVDEAVSLPQNLIDAVSELVENEYGDVAFVDPEKVTHFTAEMKKGVSIDDFRSRQKEFSDKFREFVESQELSREIEVHNDRIATNIKNRKLNKHLAVQKVLEWLAGKGIDPITFNVFGDSPSDVEMARELNAQNKRLRFIYVGENDLGELPFEVVHQGNVDHGTVEYLQTH